MVAVGAQAQHRAAVAQRGRGGVVEGVVLEAPCPKGHGADTEDGGPGDARALERELDLALDQSIPS